MFITHCKSPGRTMRTVAGAVTALVVVLSTAAVSDAASHASYHGVFHETAAGAGLGYDIHGSAKMTVGSNSTSVKITVTGLEPGEVYGSHLHNDTCANGGGGHYKHDTSGVDTPPNELWLTNSAMDLVSNNGGVAHGAGSATWAARTSTAQTNARSVVVHGEGKRIACVDLT